MTLSPYEGRVLREVGQRKRESVETAPRVVLPPEVRARVEDTTRRLASMRFLGRSGSHLKSRLTRASAGVSRGPGTLARRSLSERRVLRAVNRAGVSVSSLAEIRALDLEEVERDVRVRWLDRPYATMLAVEGAVAGVVIAGGGMMTALGGVLTSGIGAAPGVAAVGAAVATDAVAVLTAANRAVAHVGMYYGYDPLSPAEAVFGLSVINLGSAVTSRAKVSAYRELSELTRLLSDGQTWAQESERLLPRLQQQFTIRFGGRLTQRKLGHFVPVVGVAIGATLNYRLMDEVLEAAHWAYRERFLLDKLDGAARGIVPEVPAGHELDDEVVIDVLGMLEELAHGR